MRNGSIRPLIFSVGRKIRPTEKIIAAPPKNIRIERRKFFARREAENRHALAVRKVFSDEGLREIYKFYANVFRWSGYIQQQKSQLVSIGSQLAFLLL